MKSAHQNNLLVATQKTKPEMIPVDSIASTGFPLTQYADVAKVQRMQRKLRAGKNLPPIRVSRLTPEARDRYGVKDASKEYYLNNGHHRLAAVKLEGKKQIRAVPYFTGKRM